MPEEQTWITPEAINIPSDFQTAIGGHPLVAQTLYRRGFQTIETAQAFLDPDIYKPTSADELPDIQIAYQLLEDALNNRKHILVWGDFDVDGQTATTTLVEGLSDLGGNVSFHIPVRAKESHGISREVLISYLKQGFDLLITCDTGISEHENIQLVRESGIPVIVTDHHSLGETLPPANANINPQRLSSNHPLRTLPGVGVAFKLIEGLFNALNRPFNPGKFLELAALGIVADVAELKNDTRHLLQKGLINLRSTHRIGLQALYKNAELNPLHLNEDHIGFQITPRLNAVGRLADANIMVEFLMTRDEGRARVLATQIEGLNAKRRFITRQVKKAAEAKLQASPEDRHAPAIVLHHPQWPGGVVGIVAGHLAERYHKPVIILTGENPIHGSARSIEGIHIIDAIASQAELLVGYGGHPMAAGLSLSPKHLYAFKQGFLSAIETQTKLEKIVPELHVHQTITLDEIDIDLVEEIGRLAPFGSGNPRLHFMLQDLSLLSATSVGQHGEHRQILAEDAQENQQRFIWWNGSEEHMPEAHFDLVCALSQSDYKGALQVSAEWIDYRLSAKGRQEVEKRHFTITDLRNTPTPVSRCKNMLSQYPNAKIWGEGILQKGIDGLGRDELDAVDTLIIWTIPPSQSVLQEVLQKVQPQHVIVFSQDPNIDSHKTFMERLAGLAKFAIKYKDNQVELDRFAVACAVEWETIRLGLQLWEARGKLRVHFSGDSVFIKAENTLPDLTSIEIYEPILKAMLEEHRAFRRFFKTGEINSLLGQDIVQ